MEEKIVTVDELWAEFEKAIKFGNYKKFKTKIGMMRYIKKEANQHFGKELVFLFGATGYLRCRLEIKKEWIDG